MYSIHENSFCKTWTDDKGVTYIEYHEETDIDLEKAQEIVALFASNKGDNKLYLVKDLRNVRTVTTEAMEYLSNKVISRFILVEALVVSSLSSRILANFFIKKYNNPSIACEKFEDIDGALKWINEIKMQNQN